MNKSFFIILGLILLQVPLQAQVPIIEQLKQVKSSKHISIPHDIEKELNPYLDKDSVAIITFSKATGKMLNHLQTTKKEVLCDLEKTGFKQRYFMLLIDSKAIIYMDN